MNGRSNARFYVVEVCAVCVCVVFFPLVEYLCEVDLTLINYIQ